MPNNKVRNLRAEVLSENWYVLRKVTFEYLKNDGTWEVQMHNLMKVYHLISCKVYHLIGH